MSLVTHLIWESELHEHLAHSHRSRKPLRMVVFERNNIEVVGLRKETTAMVPLLSEVDQLRGEEGDRKRKNIWVRGLEGKFRNALPRLPPHYLTIWIINSYLLTGGLLSTQKRLFSLWLKSSRSFYLCFSLPYVFHLLVRPLFLAYFFYLSAITWRPNIIHV